MTGQPQAIEIWRLFDAPPDRVFAAWSTAERIARWFSPEGCSVSAAEIDFRAGGVFAVTMRLPDGQDSLCRGVFDEVRPPERLAFTMEVHMGGAARFKVRTSVDFTAVGAQTRMLVRQGYELYDADFGGAPEGAREGWRTTLDKLTREIARPVEATHGAFTIRRDLPHPPAVVYRAFTDAKAKARWFAGGDDMTRIAEEMNVVVGGREIVTARWKSGMTTSFEAVYLDVVPDARLVYAYDLFRDAQKLSVSLATVEIDAIPGGARLKITEQGVFLDGYEDNGAREHGTKILVERLAASL